MSIRAFFASKDACHGDSPNDGGDDSYHSDGGDAVAQLRGDDSYHSDGGATLLLVITTNSII